MEDAKKMEMKITFKTLLKVEGCCPKNDNAPHKWSRIVWLPDNRVWFRRCLLCDAVEVWRGNDTIYYSMSTYTLIIFHHKQDFTKDRETALKFLNEAKREAEDWAYDS